jgi:hypothetical protein
MGSALQSYHCDEHGSPSGERHILEAYFHIIALLAHSPSLEATMLDVMPSLAGLGPPQNNSAALITVAAGVVLMTLPTWYIC